MLGSWRKGNWEHRLKLEGAELLVDNLPDNFVGSHGWWSAGDAVVETASLIV